MDVKSYILELLRNGIWVFPIKGKGKSISIAKRPLAFCKLDNGTYVEAAELVEKAPRGIVERCRNSKGKIEVCKLCSMLGGEYITWKHEEILTIAEEYARRGHEAWAVWLMASKRFGIDIDSYKIKHRVNALIEKLRQLNELYSEMSARGGIHIVLAVNDDRKYKLVSRVGYIEYKHDGYFIIAPTVLRTANGIFKYTRIAGNLLDTAPVEDWDFYASLLEIDAKIVPEGFAITKHAELKVNNIDEKEGNHYEFSERLEEFEVMNIFTKERRKIKSLMLDIDDLTDFQITTLLYIIFREAECHGMAEAMRYIAKHKIVPIRKIMYTVMSNERTTRWLFQYAITTVLAYIGASANRVLEYLQSFKFIDEDEDPREDSHINAVLNVYKYKKLFLIPRGACPFCRLLLNRDSCSETPIVKAMRLGRERIKQIVDVVKTD